MSYIRITEKLKKRGAGDIRIIPAAAQGARIKVLVGGCAHCARLKQSVFDAAKKLNIPESSIEVVTDLAAIVRLGVMTTPSLIVDGRLVSSGKALTSEQVISLLTDSRCED